MQEIVGAIRLVSDIVGAITAATAQQSSGIGQVGQAVSQREETTQQNSALVEQSAAAALSLPSQADLLGGSMAVFRLQPA